MHVDLARVEEIFGEALAKRDAVARNAYLNEACGNDAELRGRVEALLAAHEAAGDFLKLPLCDSTSVSTAAVREGPGSSIGNYKLLQQIGEGGFAVVFMAEQEQPVRRRVALKIIKLGMDTRQVVARFEAERQALAMMDHPAIAKVFDAGATASGRPFFVMELVKGVPITEYCDQHKLTIDGRLDLFAQVCVAVQHAHQKGIIHRDIKPSNVLVSTQDERPVAKVIDFGIAKAVQTPLTDKTLFTDFRQLIGTPAYMSPEQADGSLDIDTRSDVYSLGVLLYELLAGTPPFDPKVLRAKAFDEMQRIIREEEPPIPSTRLSDSHDTLPSIAALRAVEPRKLASMLRGELDWIVMRCLEKHRARRYQTANALATDVMHYLADEPVSACPPSLGYKLKTFARRNRTGLAVAGLVLFFLILLGAGAGWAMRDRAAQEALAIQAQTQRQVALEHGITAALREVESRFDQENWPEAMAALKRAEGLLAANEQTSALERSVKLWRADLEAVIRLEEILLADNDEWQYTIRGSNEYEKLFRSLGIDIEAGDVAQVAQQVRNHRIAGNLIQALDDWTLSRRRLTSEKNQDRRDMPAGWWQRPLAVARQADADAFCDRVRQAVEASDFEALAAVAQLPQARNLPGSTLRLLAYDLDTKGQHRELAMICLRLAQIENPNEFSTTYALANFFSSIDQNRLLAEPSSPMVSKLLADELTYWTASLALRPQSAWLHLDLAYPLFEAGRLDEAAAACRKAIALRPDFGLAYSHLGNVLASQGNLGESAAAHRKAVELQPAAAVAHANLGAVLSQQMELDEAIASFRKAIELKPDFAIAYANLADAMRQQGKIDDAVNAYRKAVEITPDYSLLHYHFAEALLQQGQVSNAVAEYQKAIDLQPEIAAFYNRPAWILLMTPNLPDRDPPRALKLATRAMELEPADGNIWNTLAVARYRTADWQGAVAALQKSIELRQGGDAFDWLFLAMAHWQLGNKDESQKWHAKAMNPAARTQPENEQLRRLQAEAAELLEISQPQ